MSYQILQWRRLVQFHFPILIWWINFEVWITICPQVVGCPLLCVLGVQRLAVLVQFQNVCEDGIDHLNRTWLVSVQGKVIDPVKHVMCAAGHEVGKCSHSNCLNLFASNSCSRRFFVIAMARWISSRASESLPIFISRSPR